MRTFCHRTLIYLPSLQVVVFKAACPLSDARTLSSRGLLLESWMLENLASGPGTLPGHLQSSRRYVFSTHWHMIRQLRKVICKGKLRCWLAPAIDLWCACRFCTLARVLHARHVPCRRLFESPRAAGRHRGSTGILQLRNRAVSAGRGVRCL